MFDVYDYDELNDNLDDIFDDLTPKEIISIILGSISVVFFAAYCMQN